LAIGAGLLSSLRIPGLRWIVAGALLTIVMLWLGQGARENFYLVDRQAMITQPIVFLFVGFGYGYLVDKPPRLAGKRLAAPLGLATAVVIALATLNISTTLRFVSSSGDLHSRSITLEVREAIEWARDVGGPDGAAVTVIVDDYVERLWVADGLRDLARVSYPILTPDYFRVSSYGDGELDRYVVASATVFSDLPSNARVTENTRFVLYDTAGLDGALLGTINNFWGRETADGHSWEWMGDDGFVVVLRTDADAETVLNTAANPAIDAVQVDVRTPSGELVGSFIASDLGLQTLPLPPGQIVYVVLDNGPAATAPGNGDTRQLSIRVDAIAIAG
jgi:hypothetical protein